MSSLVLPRALGPSPAPGAVHYFVARTCIILYLLCPWMKTADAALKPPTVFDSFCGLDLSQSPSLTQLRASLKNLTITRDVVVNKTNNTSTPGAKATAKKIISFPFTLIPGNWDAPRILVRMASIVLREYLHIINVRSKEVVSGAMDAVKAITGCEFDAEKNLVCEGLADPGWVPEGRRIREQGLSDPGWVVP